jgi:hypothetical protein
MEQDFSVSSEFMVLAAAPIAFFLVVLFVLLAARSDTKIDAAKRAAQRGWLTDYFPFDRPHWLVEVSFPIGLLPMKDKILDAVEEDAEKKGAARGCRIWPKPDFSGRPGYDTFSTTIAFEEGDANVADFVRGIGQRMAEVFAADGLKTEEVRVSFNPEDVTYPTPEDSYSKRRKR